MKISIPIVRDDGTTAVDLVTTNVTDDIEEFVNTNNDSFSIDKEFEEGESIYQNTTGDIIPVLASGGTYVKGDLVFTDDGLGVDRVHEVINIAGDFPKQPESYTLVETSFDAANWTTGRYMKFSSKDITFPAVAIEKVAHPTLSSLVEIIFSHDGIYYFEVSPNDAETDKVTRHTLSIPYDISSIIATVRTDSKFLRSGTRNVLHMKFNSTGTKVFGAETAEDIIEEYDLSPAYDMTSMNATPLYTYSLGNCYDFWFNSDGSKLYSISSTTTISQYSLSTNWSLISVVLDGTYDASAAGSFPASGLFNNDGTVLLVNGNNVDASGIRGLKYFTLTVPYNFTSGTITYGGHIQAVVDISQMRSLAISYDGKKMITATTATPSIIYEWYLPTLHDVLNPYHSLFSSPIIEERLGVTYTYQIIKAGEDYSFSSKVDEVEEIYTPMLVHTYLDDYSLEDKAYIGGHGTWLAKTLIVRPDGAYIRTTIDAPIEYETLIDYTYNVVENISTVVGFSNVGASNPYKPFDGKNYSIATRSSLMTYIIKGVEQFDTLALGHVKATHILAIFKDSSDNIITTIDEDINVSRDANGYLADWNTTLIFYSGVIMESNSTVEVTLTGTTIELATLMLGMSAGVGFTNLALKNEYKDFSVFEYDDWGNADYTERAKVSRYSGSVDIFIEDYDMTDRLMTSLGKNLVIVNGSDYNSTSEESTSIFAATQKIGRFLSFSQKTLIKDNDMARVANYTFTLEEIV